MKYSVIGFGSIGRRHVKNILNLDSEAEIVVFDPDKNTFNQFQKENEKLNNKLIFMQDINKIFKTETDITLICSPNHLHIEHAIRAATNKSHLFIEKPLSHNIERITKLKNITKENNLINMVACNMRFHPNIRAIKEILDKNKIGKIYSVRVETAYYFPFWRPNQDYRKNYGAFREQGGGATLDCIHEIDLLLWFGGYAKEIFGLATKASDLEIETEDLTVGIVKFESDAIGEVHLDYLQKNYSRNCKIVGEKSTLYWDFNEGITKIYNVEDKKWNSYYIQTKDFDLNEMYIDEMRYFIDCVKNRTLTFNDIEKAENTLKTALKMRNLT